MTLATALTTLEFSGLIRLAQSEPELEYLFRHALIQEAAYESLLKADRRILHRAIGETLEHLYPKQLSELAPTLGQHFAAAGDAERARKYFTLAGDYALAQYANGEAERHFRQTLELSRTASDRGRAFSGLGEALFGQSHFADAFAVWCEGMAAYQSAGDTDHVLHMCARSARAASNESEARFWTLCEEGLELAQGQPDSPGLALLLCEAAGAAFSNGRRAEETLLEARECWQPLATWPLCLLSRVRAQQGRLEEARRLLAEAREQAGPQPISGDELRLPLALAQLSIAERNWPEAWAAFETVARFQKQRGLRWDYAQTLREWAEAHLARNAPGDVDRAHELLREALSEFEAMNVPKYAALVRERLEDRPLATDGKPM